MSGKRDAREYVKSGDHLPPQFRDFHDQKDLFKSIDVYIDREARGGRQVAWTAAHVYVIDIFLWYMAQRGWTLQRSRARVNFWNYREELSARREAEGRDLLEMMSKGSEP